MNGTAKERKEDLHRAVPRSSLRNSINSRLMRSPLSSSV